MIGKLRWKLLWDKMGFIVQWIVRAVRQSGPIPPYDGPWTMEDIKKLYGEMRAPWDHTAQSTDVEELMRRVPGLTRREALRI